MASHSHSGGPMAFRQNPSIATALSRPLRPKSPTGWSWVARVYQRHPDHRRGQNTPTRGLGTIISSTSTQDYVCLPGQGKHDIIFPRWRHRPEAVSMDRIKAFPQRQMWLHWEKLDSAAPWPSQRYIQVELYSGSTKNENDRCHGMPWNAKLHMHHILVKMTDVNHIHTKHKHQQLILLSWSG